MVKSLSAGLDGAFTALSDATRRGVLEQLGRRDASISELADRFHMTLAGMMKHVGVLEDAQLVVTEKVGRVRTCKLGPRPPLAEEAAWLEGYRQLWASRFDALDDIVEELQRQELGGQPRNETAKTPRRHVRNGRQPLPPRGSRVPSESKSRKRTR